MTKPVAPTPSVKEALEALDDASAQMAEREVCYKAFSKLKLVRAFIEAQTEAAWRPIIDAAGLLTVDEGETYLFAIETEDGAWDYFTDAIGWDADPDTVPVWRDDQHGWPMGTDVYFRKMPTPPKGAK